MKIQITNGMFMAIIINLVYAKAIGLTQGVMAREAGGDIWLATLFAIVQGVIIMLLTVWVILRTPDKNIIEQTSVLLGKWSGKLVGILLFVFFLGAFAMVMITFVYHLMDYFIPEAPVLLFVIVALIVGIYALYHGLEVIGRMALVGVFSILALNILLMMGSIKDFDILELMPVFQTGFLNTLEASRHNDTDWAMATLMAAMILPLVKKKQVWKNSALGGIIYGGIFVLMWPIFEAGVLSPEVTGQYIVACMQMARSAEIGFFIHRYEMIMVAFFATSAFVQIMITLFCASLAASQTFGLKDYRPVILPVSLILGAIGYWVVLDHNRAMTIMTYQWPKVALPIAFGLPFVLWILGSLLRRKLANKGNNKA